MSQAKEWTLAAQARAERDAHDFPLKSARPSSVQLERLHHAFALAGRAKAQALSPVPDWVVGAVALRLVLISGRHLEEICKLRRAPTTLQFDPDWPTPSLVEVKNHTPALWLEAGRSPHRGIVHSGNGHTGVLSKAIWLDIDPMSVSLLRKVCRPAPLGVSNGDTSRWPLFFNMQAKNDLEAAVDAFLKHASERLGVDLRNSAKIIEQCSEFLARRLATSVPGDPAVSWLVTNKVPKRNATKSFYSATRLADVQHYHHKAVKALPARVTGRPAAGLVQNLPNGLGERVIGSPYCPTPKAIDQLRQVLQTAAKIGRGRVDLARATEIDHAYTAYCWLFFSLHTGWRPPRLTLLPSMPDIDWSTGFFLLDDKRIRGAVSAIGRAKEPENDLDVECDSEDVATIRNPSDDGSEKTSSATSRYRWLPLSAHVRAQLLAYYDHIAAREKMRRRKLRPFSVPQLKDKEALEKYLRSLPGLQWNLPMNFNRHYLRSNLIGRVGADAIDAYLGHWQEGCEPWWNGSCIDPLGFMTQTQQAIAELFPEKDWPVLKGFR